MPTSPNTVQSFAEGFRTKRDYVVLRLSEDILSGTIKPGQRVSPDAVAREYGISHIPVREVLGELEGRGYLQRIGNRGYFVPELSIEEVVDIYNARQIIEDAVNGLAINNLVEADFAEMRKLHSLMRIARKSGDWRDYRRHNRDFHFVAFSACGSPILLGILNMLWDRAGRYQVPYFHEHGRAPTVATQHDQLIKAYETRDVVAVNRIMSEHRSVTLKTCRQYLP